MPKRILTKALVGIAIILLLIACFQITPISISLGQNNKEMDKRGYSHLQPGEWYLVYSDKAFSLPAGAKWNRAEGIGGRMRHDGMGKNKSERCGGFIKMELQDNGNIKYQCILCDRKWVRNAEGKLVKNFEGK